MKEYSFTDLIESKLKLSKQSILAQWQNPLGTSTRHFYVDTLLPDEICNKIYHAFPLAGDGFHDQKSFREKKKTSANLNSFNEILSEITYSLQDRRILNIISEYTNTENLFPDPKLYAGGLSMMFKGDFLNPHLDNSHDMERSMYRRLNALYYVSPEWGMDTGGNLELWDDERKTPKTIHSKFNRLVIMETNNSSWHSVSRVLVDRPRCCVSNYYFSFVSPSDKEYFHVTSFTGRPGQSFHRFYGWLDNHIRNVAASIFGVGRGKNLINKNEIKRDKSQHGKS